MSAEEPADEVDDAPPSTSSSAPALLPSKSVRHIMKSAMGGDADVITAESVDAVQRCTGEFLSFVTSEARARAVRDGRASVSYADIVGALGTCGFRCAPFRCPEFIFITRPDRLSLCPQALHRAVEGAHDAALQRRRTASHEAAATG